MAQNADRIDQRGLHGALQLDVLFDVGRKALQNGVENTARLARFHHVDVQRVEDLGVLPHGGGQVAPPSTEPTRAGQNLLKGLVLLLARENFQTLHQRQAGINHDGELAGEDGQFLGVDAAAEGGQVEFLALLGHFRGGDLLALQQVLQFVLLAGRHLPR